MVAEGWGEGTKRQDHDPPHCSDALRAIVPSEGTGPGVQDLRTVHFFTHQQCDSGQLIPISAYLLTNRIKPYADVSFTDFCKERQGCGHLCEVWKYSESRMVSLLCSWGKLFMGLGTAGLAAYRVDREEGLGLRGEAKRARGWRGPLSTG